MIFLHLKCWRQRSVNINVTYQIYIKSEYLHERKCGNCEFPSASVISIYTFHLYFSCQFSSALDILCTCERHWPGVRAISDDNKSADRENN